MTTQIVTDTLDEYVWASRQSVFDPNGFLIQEILTYDDGRVKTTTLVDGLPTSVEHTDPLNAASWTTISIGYFTPYGRINERVVAYDDGRSLTESFDPFGNVITYRQIEDTGDRFSWASQFFHYAPTGALSSHFVRHDDGREVTAQFANGVQINRYSNDRADAYDWHNRTFTYDSNGVLQSIATTLDSGVVETKSSFLGPVSGEISKTDVNDRFAWDSITTTYDAAGMKVSTVRIDDNGIQNTTNFANNVPSTVSRLDLDDVKAWEYRNATYNAQGQLVLQTQRMDAGFDIYRSFAAGKILQRFDDDRFDVRDWTERTFTYDQQGRLESSTVQWDSGVTVNKTYSNGVLQQVVRTDVDDAHSWATILKQYGGPWNASLLYVVRTADDGTRTIKDSRGLDVFTGGTSGTVTEDAGPTLVATGSISMVDGYRGSSVFVAQSGVAGSLGLGLFDVDDSGTWTYRLTNNTFDVQTLNAGESLAEQITLQTQDGAEVIVDVTIQGQDDGPVPIYVGDSPVYLGELGNLAATPINFDLGSLFSDDQAEDLTIRFINNAVSGFRLVDGILSANNQNSIEHFGVSHRQLTATDSDGNLAYENVILTMAIAHDFGDDFASNILPSTRVDAGQHNDRLVFGTGAGGGHGTLYIYTWEGQDDVEFGNSAAGLYGSVFLDTYVGNDTVTFGANAAASGSDSAQGSVHVVLGWGEDTFQAGNNFASIGGVGLVDGGGGNDRIIFADNAGRWGGQLTIEAGTGNDQIIFGTRAGAEATAGQSAIDVHGDAGDDNISFSNDAARDNGNLRVYGGDGNDTVQFGQSAASYGGELLVEGGAGDDRITLGASAGYSSGLARVYGGTGNDFLSVSQNSGTAGGSVELYGGVGEDTFTVLPGSRNITFDFGVDTDVDTLSILGEMSGRITNYVRGQDIINIENLDGIFWNVFDQGADRVLQSSNGHNLTVTGAAGVDLVDILPGAIENVAPVFVGTADMLPRAEVGSYVWYPYSIYLDAQTLFSDANTSLAVAPDQLTIAVGALPPGVTYSYGYLEFLDSQNFGLTGVFTIDITATDLFGLSVTQTLNFEIGQSHNYGDYEPVFYLTDYVNGSVAGDVITVGSVYYEVTNEGAGFELNSLAGDDTVAVGDVTMDSDYSTFHLNTDAGDDDVTFRRFEASGAGAFGRILLGVGADVLTFWGDADGVRIDLGADTDADTLILTRSVEDGRISNWTQGVDTVDVFDHTLWAVTLDDGTDTTLSDGTSTLTFLGVTGLTDAGDFLI